MIREEAKSCICTIKMLQRLAYNIHGVMDVIDADNCKKIIKALEQEPCDDAISRQDTLKTIIKHLGIRSEEYLLPAEEAIYKVVKNMPSVTPTHKEWIPVPEGATNKDMFKTVFGYEPATDAVVCNKEDWCGASKPCNYCFGNPNAIGREEEWWNAPYKAESEV